MKSSNQASISAIILALGIISGALGAHSLENYLNTEQLSIWNKAVLYHLIHGLGLLIVSIITKIYNNINLKWCFYLLFAGIILFSGSLYLIALNNGVFGEIQFLKKALIPITPIGGLCFIAGWILLAIKMKNT